VTHPKKPLILTHRDVDGVCAAAIAKASYPEAEVEFANPPDFVSMLDSLSGYDCVIILDLGIDSAQKDEAIAAFRKLSTTSNIIYIDHHIRAPGLNESSLACKEAYRTDASTSELAWEFFKPTASLDFIAVLGAIGDYKERTPQMQGLIERYDERKVYPEALFLEWALMVSEDSFKRSVVEELAQGRWPYQMSIMGKEADAIVRRQRTLERYVREKAEKICEHVMLIRDPPFKATGPAATLLTKLDNVDIGIASRTDEKHVYLSLRRHEESDINLASLIDKSASKFGGMGGGHLAASGGKIPAERFDEFLLEIRRMLPEGRLKRINRLDVGSVDKKKIERKLFNEIIERKRMEDLFRESETKLRTLLEKLPQKIFFKDNNSVYKYANWNYARDLKIHPDKIIGRTDYDFYPKKLAEKYRADDKRIIESRKTEDIEEEYIQDGQKVFVHTVKTPVKDENGHVIGVLGIFWDITERKRAENALLESEERFRRLSDVAFEAIVIHENGKILDVNKTFAEMYGYKLSEVIGMNVMDFVAPESHDLVSKNILSGHEDPHEVVCLRKDGSTFIAGIRARAIPYQGRIAMVAAIEDITERKKAEYRVKLEREIYQSVARAANRSRTVEEFCEMTLKDIQKVIKYDMADVMVYREAADALFSVAWVGYPEDLYQRTIKWQDLKEESRVATQAARKRKSIYIDDVKASKLTGYAHDLIAKYDISTLYVVPLFSQDKLQGVLEVLTVGGKRLSTEDREVLDTISEELAGGIAKAKNEKQLVTVKEIFGWLGMPQEPRAVG
jgi:PAS domain S-box-containing protein